MTSTLVTRHELVADVSALARDTASNAEGAGQLDDAVIAALHASGVLRIMLAEDQGGRDYSLAECFPLFESLAQADGAVGWITAIGCTALGVVGRRLAAETAGELLVEHDALVAGGVNPITARAEVADGGYRLTGRVGFASGSAHATRFVAGAAVYSGNSIVESPAGGPVLVGLLLAPDDVSVVDSWHVTGLRATSSHDLEFDDIFVPASNSFSMAGPALRPNPGDPTESLPMLTRLGPGIAHVCIGIAMHALDEMKRIAGDNASFGTPLPARDRADVQIAAARAQALVDSGRAYLRDAWLALSEALTVGSAQTDDLARVRLAAVTAVSNAVEATDIAFVAAGSAAIYTRYALERCWRDIHVAQHHVMVSTRHMQRVGQVFLGLPAGPGPL